MPAPFFTAPGIQPKPPGTQQTGKRNLPRAAQIIFISSSTYHAAMIAAICRAGLPSPAAIMFCCCICENEQIEKICQIKSFGLIKYRYGCSSRQPIPSEPDCQEVGAVGTVELSRRRMLAPLSARMAVILHCCQAVISDGENQMCRASEMNREDRTTPVHWYQYRDLNIKRRYRHSLVPAPRAVVQRGAWRRSCEGEDQP